MGRIERGFTLIEVVVVIIVLAVVASITVPRAIKVSPAQKVQRAALSLTRDLEQLRMRAIAAKRRIRVHFYQPQNFYSAFMDVTTDHAGTIAETEEEARAAGLLIRGSSGGIPGVELPTGVTFGAGLATSGPLGGTIPAPIDLENGYVEFDARGMVIPPGEGGGAIYLEHEEDPNAVAVVTISGASAFRAYRYINGEWVK
ncbi:MAG: prepilin-type N-terminal cleavage/methylation domain-containing protein [Gemmatimonadetes bacterium]|uniref:Prepilin-type N-terminal cleavage/methylation domain-containing protein n=1 Tax=Candidatus Kutchimonas denitrificans TaxID=3056748 RepID=A0AAE4Z7Y3_9BACT|nr:prepilin-type N-terminal cleavage/methylation domain-containing protein [Gemmatimonadota bacterium]NIR75323.1 prepilin-type N-terminal cleavage/methylation domain-containing protein [Candidatus Kutchimonas denitrificans]NIS02149.1 prepilin-type N-terminal cleavage/methylation domain-containing protein [Gemmatimonadota bacterium]NIT67974.1 prepilin-type N-terminal cleavage/methylation domain-containing protein [Gemmatimonadota bacterium]NIU53968.1 prepilin-type N-terminal cleavage/methylation